MMSTIIGLAVVLVLAGAGIVLFGTISVEEIKDMIESRRLNKVL